MLFKSVFAALRLGRLRFPMPRRRREGSSSSASPQPVSHQVQELPAGSGLDQTQAGASPQMFQGPVSEIQPADVGEEDRTPPAATQAHGGSLASSGLSVGDHGSPTGEPQVSHDAPLAHRPVDGEFPLVAGNSVSMDQEEPVMGPVNPLFPPEARVEVPAGPQSAELGDRMLRTLGRFSVSRTTHCFSLCAPWRAHCVSGFFFCRFLLWLRTPRRDRPHPSCSAARPSQSCSATPGMAWTTGEAWIAVAVLFQSWMF